MNVLGNYCAVFTSVLDRNIAATVVSGETFVVTPMILVMVTDTTWTNTNFSVLSISDADESYR
jgi:hypothetical protein